VRGKWKTVIGTLVAGVILLFIIRSLVSGLRDLGSFDFEVSWTRSLGAFAMLALVFPLYGLIWQYVLARFGYRISYGRSMRIWFLSQAGRYIPGKVWFALGRIYLCERQGIPRSVATVAMGLELALVLASALLIFGIAWALSPSLGQSQYRWGLWLVPAILAGVHPRLLNGILGRLGKAPNRIDISYSDILGILGLYALCWCIYGVGFYLAGTALRLDAGIKGLEALSMAKALPDMIGINALSWSGGLLSIVTPAGLGVREGISTILLGRVVEAPYPVLIPLIARLWVTIGEVGTIALLLVFGGRE
jgi:hypothetical protein